MTKFIIIQARIKLNIMIQLGNNENVIKNMNQTFVKLMDWSQFFLYSQYFQPYYFKATTQIIFKNAIGLNNSLKLCMLFFLIFYWWFNVFFLNLLIWIAIKIVMKMIINSKINKGKNKW